MAYTTKSTLISRPIEPAFGASEDLGDIWDTIKGGTSSALDFFGSGLKAQGAQEALAAQLAAQQAQQQAQQQSGVSTTTLLIGGAVLAGVLVFAMRRK